MSQAGILNNAIIPPFAGVVTLTGNDAIAVGPDGADNIFLLGVNGLTVTNTAPFTLSINSGTSAEATTFDDTPTIIGTPITLALNSAITITAMITGARDDFSASAWGQVTFGARRDGGGTTAVEFPLPFTLGTDSAPTNAGFTADVAGNTIAIQVIGVAAQTWNWTAIINTVTQS